MAESDFLDRKPEEYYDYELVVSRDAEALKLFSIPTDAVLPIYYFKGEDSFYIELEKDDRRFFEVYKRARAGGRDITETGNRLLIKYLDYRDYRKMARYPMGDLSTFPGVKADSFYIHRGKRDHWRFRFIRESTGPVSDYVISAVDDLNQDIGQNVLTVDYLGKPRSDLQFLREHGYQRSVVAVNIREINTTEYREMAPYYSSPFHSESKHVGVSGPTDVIRFSRKIPEMGGVTVRQEVLRNSGICIFEESIKPVVTSGFLDFKKSSFFPLFRYQDYDGTDPIHTWILDRNDIGPLLSMLKRSNDVLGRYAHFIVESLDTYYEPGGTSESGTR